MKLNSYGTKGKALKWFESYLENRTQTVKHCYSTFRNIDKGILQGSILGPLMFLFFFNPLHA